MALDIPYNTLDSNKRQFRLVRLLDTPDKSIALSLTTYALDQAPEYEALSYVWGEEPADEAIKVNGKDFCVRPNLSSYLHQRRNHRQLGHIFIDAICINQDDVAERSSQVRLFGEIYNKASVVEAWLGEGTKMEGATLSEMQSFIDAREGPALRRHVEEVSHAPDKSTRQSLREHYMSDQNLGQNATEVLISMICEKYWSRLWIVPELLHAREVVVKHGSLYISLDLLRVVSELHKEELDDDPSSHLFAAPHDDADADAFDKLGYITLSAANSNRRPISAVVRVWLILYTKKTFGDPSSCGRRLTIVDAICSFSGQACRIPHDMIFALVGATGSTIAVDYSISLLDLFAMALVEGFIELDNMEARKSSSASLVYKRLSFYSSLLGALDLRPWSTAVITITRSVHGIFAQHDPGFTTISLNFFATVVGIMGGYQSSALFRKLSWTIWKFAELISGRAMLSERFQNSVFRREYTPDVHEIYFELLESKYSAVTKLRAIERQIPRIVDMSLSDASLLAQQIAEFPTRREAFRLVTCATKAGMACLDSSALAESRVKRLMNRLALLQSALRQLGDELGSEPELHVSYSEEEEDAS